MTPMAWPDIRVSVELSMDASSTLTVADTGSAIPAAAIENLFRAPVANSGGGGLGIGLYQAFNQATQAGYALSLAGNLAGEVRFELRKS